VIAFWIGNNEYKSLKEYFKTDHQLINSTFQYAACTLADRKDRDDKMFEAADGLTPFQQAVLTYNVDMVAMMLRIPGININVKSADGRTVHDILKSMSPSQSQPIALYQMRTLIQRHADLLVEGPPALIDNSEQLIVICGGRPSDGKEVSVPIHEIQTQLKHDVYGRLNSLRWQRLQEMSAHYQVPESPSFLSQDEVLKADESITAAKLTFVMSGLPLPGSHTRMRRLVEVDVTTNQQSLLKTLRSPEMKDSVVRSLIRQTGMLCDQKMYAVILNVYTYSGDNIVNAKDIKSNLAKSLNKFTVQLVDALILNACKISRGHLNQFTWFKVSTPQSRQSESSAPSSSATFFVDLRANPNQPLMYFNDSQPMDDNTAVLSPSWFNTGF